jgi:hypothetical protein
MIHFGLCVRAESRGIRMFCGQCGNDVGEGAAVCSRCGAQLPQRTGQAGAAEQSGPEYGSPPQGGAAHGGYPPHGDVPQGGVPPGGPPQAGYGASQGDPAQTGTPLGGPAQPGYGAPRGGYGDPAGGPGYGAPAGYPPPAAGPPGAPGGYGGPAGAPQAGAGYPASAPGQPPGPAAYPPQGGQPQGAWSTGQAGRAAAPAFNFDAKRWTPADMIVGGASLVVLISLFLPWFTASLGQLGSGSESGTDGHGWLWIVFIVVLLILAYLVLKAGFQTMPFTVPLQHELLLLIATGINLVLVVIAFLAKPSIGFGVQVGWGVGAFLALIAAIVAVVPLVLEMRNSASASRPG